jgi:hypothetical protein
MLFVLPICLNLDGMRCHSNALIIGLAYIVTAADGAGGTDRQRPDRTNSPWRWGQQPPAKCDYHRHDVVRRLASCTSTALRTSDGASIKIFFHLLPALHVIVKQKVFSSKFVTNSLFLHSTHGCDVAQKAFGQGQSNPLDSVLPFQAAITSRDLLSELHQTSCQSEPPLPFLCGPATLEVSPLRHFVAAVTP